MQYMHGQVPVVRDYPDLSMPHRPITQADDPRKLNSQGQHVSKYAGAGTQAAVASAKEASATDNQNKEKTEFGQADR